MESNLDAAEYASLLTGNAYKELFQLEAPTFPQFAASSAMSLTEAWAEEFVNPGDGFVEPIPVVVKEEPELESGESSTDHDCSCRACLCVDCQCSKDIKAADTTSDRT